MSIDVLTKRGNSTHYNCSVCGTTFVISGVHQEPPSCPYSPWHSDASETVGESEQ